MERNEIRVAFLKGEGAEGKAEGNVVDGIRFRGSRGGDGGNTDVGLRSHLGDFLCDFKRL